MHRAKHFCIAFTEEDRVTKREYARLHRLFVQLRLRLETMSDRQLRRGGKRVQAEADRLAKILDDEDNK